MDRLGGDFDAVMRDNMRAVRAYAASVTSSHDLAEEAVQETFIRAWRYSSSYRGDAPVISWLITICRRAIVDLAQREDAHRHDALSQVVVGTPDSSDTTAINDMIAGLPLPQREVLVLCAVLGFDYQTAADTLAIPVGTVRSRLARARAALADDMRDAMVI